ncbi:hypothetical protein [Subtercola endophyticus]|uniref:hypothetical protein n=1 Tax=Subtercola endophyticus TaxID=2895559 RepID=UPI001E507685|nr:hypothetical protein [Subtercola endophyticus]UFS59505.1 hypothetical protein LQ955_01505 [Subtercola endophyticus]
MTRPQLDPWELQHSRCELFMLTEIAEQLRISNLIRWHSFVAAQGDMPDHETELAGLINEGLELA